MTPADVFCLCFAGALGVGLGSFVTGFVSGALMALLFPGDGK